MAQSDISRNPTKGFLRDGEMPPFPEQTVHAMLKRFGMEEACDLQPWPYGPYDILAAFSFRGTGYLLKARIFEHRGERSLYETHYIQERLLALGLPSASYYSAPGGETLLKGPHWEKEQEAFYEVQEILPGQYLVPNEDTVKQAGTLAAQLLIHGNFCADNVLVDGERALLIDFEEVGLGEASDDLCSFILNSPGLDIPMIQSFLRAYQDGGGALLGDDRLVLHSNLVKRELGECVDRGEPFKVGDGFDKFTFLLVH